MSTDFKLHIFSLNLIRLTVLPVTSTS